jgi:hypothetical protein
MIELPPAPPQSDDLDRKSNDALERLIKTELRSLEHEELMHVHEDIQDLLLQQPQNMTWHKALAVVSELDSLRSKDSPLPRLLVLAGKNFLSVAQAEELALRIQNEYIIKVVRLLARILAVLRKRAEFIEPS